MLGVFYAWPQLYSFCRDEHVDIVSLAVGHALPGGKAFWHAKITFIRRITTPKKKESLQLEIPRRTSVSRSS